MADTTMYRMAPDEVRAVKKNIVRLVLDEGEDSTNPAAVCDLAMVKTWGTALTSAQIPADQWGCLIDFAEATITEWAD